MNNSAYNSCYFPLLWLSVVLGLASCHSSVKNDENHSNDSLALSDRTETATPITDSSWLLIPGVSAGKTKLNEPADSVYKRLGKADGGDAAMGKAVAFWYANGDSTGNVLSIFTSRDMGNDETARIKQIRVTSPSFKTNTGLGPGSEKKDIETAFALKQKEGYEITGKKVNIMDAAEGIAFELDETGTCIAVIIHGAGTDHTSYLPLRPTN